MGRKADMGRITERCQAVEHSIAGMLRLSNVWYHSCSPANPHRLPKRLVHDLFAATMEQWATASHGAEAWRQLGNAVRKRSKEFAFSGDVLTCDEVMCSTVMFDVQCAEIGST